MIGVNGYHVLPDMVCWSFLSLQLLFHICVTIFKNSKPMFCLLCASL